MRILLLALGLCLASVLAATAHPPAIVNADGARAVAEEIVDFRRRMAEAIRSKDATALRRMYAETFQHVHGSAKVDGRDARIAAAMAGDPAFETAEADDLKVTAHAGGWVAVATATSRGRPRAGGKAYVERWTAVYVRTETSWQLVASHATRSYKATPK